MTMTTERAPEGFLRRLSESDLDLLLGSASLHDLSKGDQIHDGVGVILTGVVATSLFGSHDYNYGADGISFHGAGELVGLEDALNPGDHGGSPLRATYDVRYDVRSDHASVYVLPRSRFRQLAVDRLSSAIMLEQAARADRAMREKLWTTQTAFRRVIMFLVDMAGRFGRPHPDGVAISFPLSQADIALAVGISRQAVEMQMATLRKYGLARTGYRQLILTPKLTENPWKFA